jgi:hypothetical protein
MGRAYFANWLFHSLVRLSTEEYELRNNSLKTSGNKTPLRPSFSHNRFGHGHDRGCSAAVPDYAASGFLRVTEQARGDATPLGHTITKSR